MAATGDLIDFEVIESSKENIQSLPSGRSAKSLARILSPVAIQSPSNTQDVNDAARQEFEKEIAAIDDSDDPLDVYDRYVKWTMNAYPSAQATPQSQLLPLLERATKSFIASTHYKNDPRYLRIWLNYIRFFADAPRETFAYLARHNIGAELALFYEEFAAWLENANRWPQAEEVYKMGIERQARPVDRLMRKFGEFEQRNAARPQDAQEPSSPALPAVRPALAAKFDPLSSTAAEAEQDPQAAARKATATGKKNKLEIFADDGKSEDPAATGSVKGWNNMGTLADRKKENAVGATAWKGETMKSNTDKASLPPKMMIFKDPTMSRIAMPVSNHPVYEQRVRNPRTGRYECVAINLEAMYPDPEDPSVEFCFDELMLARRQERQWRRSPAREPLASSPRKNLDSEANARQPTAASHTPKRIALNDATDENDENAPAFSPSIKVPKSGRKSRKGDKDNKTRKIVMREVRGETQTIQTNFDSPQGPRVRRKKSHDPTMTLHSKEAQDEMYDIFNAPLKSEQTQSSVASEAESSSDESSSSSSEDEDDDYTSVSVGDSTSTGHLSAGASELGDDTTRGDLTETPSVADGDATTTTATNTNTNTGWTDFDTRRDVPGQGVEGDVDVGAVAETNEDTGRWEQPAQSEEHEQTEDLITPTSPTPSMAQTRYIPVPPEDYEPPPNPYRNPDQVARNRLPFMTPIVEKTESSLGAATAPRNDMENMITKTPCPKGESRMLDMADAPASSPFSALLEEADVVSEKPIAMPKLEEIETKTQSSTPLFPPNTQSTLKKETPGPGMSKGPIIKDKQCNPMNVTLRDTILSEMHPPISTFKGYFDHGTQSGRRNEIKKYCKAVKTNAQTPLPAPVLNFEGSERALTIKRELGAGAYAPVYLAEPTEEDSETTTTTDMIAGGRGARLEAIKMEEPPSAWEFYMLRAAKRRLGVSRAADSVIDAFEFHSFADECYLVLEYRSQGTLLDLVNGFVREHAAAGGGPGHSGALDEPLAMFFAVELLRTVEALHAKGIIHGDIKADNVLVRLDDPLPVSGSSELRARYARDGSGGWSAKGVALIDFGRGIDMRAFAPGAQFVADWPTSDADCAEMRELRPWTFQADYHGVAAVLHALLFGKYIETAAERGAGVGPGAAKTWRLRENLKRYWQVDVWGAAFALLLNSGRAAEAEEGGRLPALRGLRAVREDMESWLEENCERGVGLRTLIRRAETLANNVRRRN